MSSCKIPFILVTNFNETNFFNRISKNIQTLNITKIGPRGTESFQDDRRTDITKVAVAFHTFSNVP